MFPDCRAKPSRSCSPKKSDNSFSSNTHSYQVCESTYENKLECEKPFLELNSNYWCDCRPPIHRDCCQYCDAKKKNVVKRYKPPE